MILKELTALHKNNQVSLSCQQQTLLSFPKCNAATASQCLHCSGSAFPSTCYFSPFMDSLLLCFPLYLLASSLLYDICLLHAFFLLLPWHSMRLHVFVSSTFTEEIWGILLVPVQVKSAFQGKVQVSGPCILEHCKWLAILESAISLLWIRTFGIYLSGYLCITWLVRGKGQLNTFTLLGVQML